MYEIDNLNGLHMNVVQSLKDNDDTYPYNIYYMQTENEPPGFTLIRCIKENVDRNPALRKVSQEMNNGLYLSSELLMDFVFTCNKLGQDNNFLSSSDD